MGGGQDIELVRDCSLQRLRFLPHVIEKPLLHSIPVEIKSRPEQVGQGDQERVVVGKASGKKRALSCSCVLQISQNGQLLVKSMVNLFYLAVSSRRVD